MAIPNLPENALALALAAADTKLENTSLSAGASDVSYRLGAALLLKYASLEIHKNLGYRGFLFRCIIIYVYN